MMRRGKDVIGRPIVSLDLGCAVEQVEDLIFDRVRNRVVGLLVDRGSWFRSPRVVPLRNVHALGQDAITVPSGSVIVDVERVPDIQVVLERKNVLHGTKVVTSHGEELGTIQDVCFDERTGNAEAFEISSGDADSSTETILPASEEVMIGEDVAIVSDELSGTLLKHNAPADPAARKKPSRRIRQDRRNGNGANGGDKIGPPATALGTEEHSISKSGLEAASEKMKQAMTSAGERLNEGARQMQKTAGELWETTKQKAGTLQHRAQDAIEARRIKSALGRRSDRVILDADDHVILNEGDVITHEAVDRARHAGVLDLLLQSARKNSSETAAAPSGSNKD